MADYEVVISRQLQERLDALPPPQRRVLFLGLHRAAEALASSGGQRAWGERVSCLVTPTYILTSGSTWLLYEVDVGARTVVARSVAQVDVPAGVVRTH